METALTDHKEQTIAAHANDSNQDDGLSSEVKLIANIPRIGSDNNYFCSMATLLDLITTQSLTVRIIDKKQYSLKKTFWVVLSIQDAWGVEVENSTSITYIVGMLEPMNTLVAQK